MSEPAVVIESLTKIYKSLSGNAVTPFTAFDFTIQQGEFVTVVGPTGCGKTTLLNLVAGLDTPSGGTVSLCEELEGQGKTACVFQHYTLFPWRTVIRNVTFGMQMNGTPRRQRKKTAGELLDLLGLKGFERSYPHELSGGMRQRTAIAQALAVEPGLLLMDEPFGALDDSTRRELQGVITRIWRERELTILFVTHSIDEAIVLGDRVVIFPGGSRSAIEYGVDLARPRDSLSSEYTDLLVRIREAIAPEIP